MYPALAVLDRLNSEFPDVETLWVGSERGMEGNLVTKAGVTFETIPAAGVHGVGISQLPGNISKILKGILASHRLLRFFQPDVIFFTGGYVAFPMAVAGLRLPQILFVPDIEPGLALKFLAYFADIIAVTVSESKKYFQTGKKLTVTGYPVRHGLSTWNKEDALGFFGLSQEIPTLLVTGGSLGSLSINQALVNVLPELLTDIQIIHLTGSLTWTQFSQVPETLGPEASKRYKSFPYLHDEMGAALTIADLVLSRAGASSIGEYPYFGIPAILVPYPHAWRYQKVNAEYLVENGAAVILPDDQMNIRLLALVRKILNDPEKLSTMREAMSTLAVQDSAGFLARVIYSMDDVRKRHRN